MRFKVFFGNTSKGLLLKQEVHLFLSLVSAEPRFSAAFTKAYLVVMRSQSSSSSASYSSSHSAALSSCSATSSPKAEVPYTWDSSTYLSASLDLSTMVTFVEALLEVKLL